jgi:hypothetical protein
MPYEPDDLYIDQTRVEWADRYGGVGAGKGGGSGRCSSFDGLQTKGVGRTALAPPEGDENHSSGTLVLLEAAAEAVFSRIYQIALPFGAVPVHAIIWTGGRFIRGRSGGMQDIRMRTLAVRPFVARPAHFMRNPDFMPGREPAGVEFRGLSADAARVKIALGALARNLSHAMGLQNDPSRDVTHALNAGLLEWTRRVAWQCAAAFAKRLPHGTLSCSNVALSGAYLDFGLSNFLPTYQRVCWAGNQDLWTEAGNLVRTAELLVKQISKYMPLNNSAGLVEPHTISNEFGVHFGARLAIEMSKMAGLTEDIATECPVRLRDTWFRSMRAILAFGSDEPVISNNPGRMSDGRGAPAPRRGGRYDLNAILRETAWRFDPVAWDAELSARNLQANLRRDFISASMDVCLWLSQWSGASMASVQGWLAQQASRKNSVLQCLVREHDKHVALPQFRQFEEGPEPWRIGAAIEERLRKAAYVLGDFDRDMSGKSGAEQLRSFAQ